MTSYTPLGSHYPTKNISKIFLNYVKGEFLFDVVPLIPFVEIVRFPGSRFLLLLKVMRLRSVVTIMDTKTLMAQIKGVY